MGTHTYVVLCKVKKAIIIINFSFKRVKILNTYNDALVIFSFLLFYKYTF